MIVHMPTDKNLKLENRPISPKTLLEQEKRIRRAVANSNERRRMQSINAGFQSLRALLPHAEDEKLSKAAILQSTADYVLQLEQEKAKLLEQNNHLSRKVLLSPRDMHDSDGSCSGSPLLKRKKREPADSIDEGIGNSSPSRSENGADDPKREIMELRLQLEHERTVRVLLEQRLLDLEASLYPPDKSHAVSEKINLHYHNDMEKSLNFGHENGLNSPQSQMSNPDMECSHEMSLQASSPDLSNLDASEDLFRRKGMLPIVDELRISNTNVPSLAFSTSNVSTKSIPVEFDITSHQSAYKVNSTSRQNLETIVEAIRLVEGDHLFRDDPEPVKSTLSDSIEKSVIKDEEQSSVTLEQHIAFKSQNILFRKDLFNKESLMQTRPGVIVSKLS